jgi:protein-tyrosine phosphatase
MVGPIVISAVPNLRDLGGHPAVDGMRVRKCLVYRSDDLVIKTGADAEALASLGLRVVFDLRTRNERDHRPDQLPDGVAHMALNVLADVKTDGVPTFAELIEKPMVAAEVLGQGRAVALFERTYRDFVSSQGARSAYRQLFLELTDADCTPALFHCATGKDRTGWAAAALLLLLGVPFDVVLADYLRSNDHIIPAFQHVFDKFEARGGDLEILRAIFGVREEYLAAALAEMSTRFGDIEGYFAEGLGIDGATQDRLRAALLEPRP